MTLLSLYPKIGIGVGTVFFTKLLIFERKSYMKNVSEIMFGWCLTFEAVYINMT